MPYTLSTPCVRLTHCTPRGSTGRSTRNLTFSTLIGIVAVMLLLTLGCQSKTVVDSAIWTAPALNMTTYSLAPAVERVPYEVSLEVVGGTPPLRYESLNSYLPYGLRLEPSSGRLYGIPSRNGTFDFQIRVKDAQGRTLLRSLELVVSPWNPATSISCGASGDVTLTASALYSGVGHQFQSLDAVAFFQLQLPPPSTSDLRIMARSDYGDPAVFLGRPGHSAGSTLVAYHTIRAVHPGDEVAHVNSHTSPSLQEYFDDGRSIAMVIAATEPGTFHYEVQCHSGPYFVHSYLTNAIASQSYYQAVEIAGGTPPYTVSSESSLPEGLELSSDGALSGTPLNSGAFELDLTVVDAQGLSDQQRISLLIPEPWLLTCNDDSPFEWSAEVPAFNDQLGLATPDAVQFFSIGFPDATSRFSITIEALDESPMGLFWGDPTTLVGSSDLTAYGLRTIDPAIANAGLNTLELSTNSVPSIADYAGSIAFAIAAFKAGGRARVQTTCSQELSIASRFIPPATRGSAYSASLAARGGSGLVSWINSAPLPDGLTLTESGQIQGTPTLSGAFTVDVSCTDSAGAHSSCSLFLNIGEAEAMAGCGNTPVLECGDVVAVQTTANAWLHRLSVDLSDPDSSQVWCLNAAGAGQRVEITVENSSGDADLFTGFPGMTPGDRNINHYFRFSTLEGDDALIIDRSASYPNLDHYADYLGLAVVAYEPGYSLLSVNCE